MKNLMMEGLMPLGRGGTMLISGEEVLHVLFSGLNKHGALASITCMHAHHWSCLQISKEDFTVFVCVYYKMNQQDLQS